MSNILLKRGTSVNFNAITLKSGEPAFVIDLGKLYIGNGTSKILINPINKPTGINITNYYPKVLVNDYGQVVGQNSLIVTDIPSLPTSKITGLGTAALVNTGISNGNLPLLDVNGKLPQSVIPNNSVEYAFAYFMGTNGTIVNPNQIVPLNTYNVSSSIFTFDNGSFSINETGLYMISYNITTSSLQMSTALAYATNGTWSGSMSRCSTTAVPAYVTTCATIVRNITTIPEKYGIKNIGTLDISLLSGYGSISIAKIK